MKINHNCQRIAIFKLNCQLKSVVMVARYYVVLILQSALLTTPTRGLDFSHGIDY